MAYKVFTNGSVLQASEINDNLMRQSVMVFSNAAARTAAITSPLEGMLTWLEDVNRFESYDSSGAWTSPFGLTQIVNQTIGTAVSSVTVTNAFSATYDAYKIVVSGGLGSITNQPLFLKLGASANSHNSLLQYAQWGGTGATQIGSTNSGSFGYVGAIQSDSIFMNCDLVNPFLAKQTYGTASYSDVTNAGNTVFRHTGSTSFTDFTIIPASGTLTGGNIAVYGYRKV